MPSRLSLGSYHIIALGHSADPLRSTLEKRSKISSPT
jgi:hypothetical protein